MMKRPLVIGSALVATALTAAAVIVGPELVAGYRFMAALDRYYVRYEANGGAWPQIQDSCALCHGVNGQPSNEQYPSLAGQSAAYLEAQLHAFATGKRHSAQMGPLAAGLSEAQIESLAEYFSRQQPRPTETPEADDALSKRGQAVVDGKGCIACHGEGLVGSALGPRLAGQGKLYLQDQLQAFKQEQRQDPTQAMNVVAAALTAEELEAAAHYLAELPPTAAR